MRSRHLTPNMGVVPPINIPNRSSHSYLVDRVVSTGHFDQDKGEEDVRTSVGQEGVGLVVPRPLGSPLITSVTRSKCLTEVGD